jgi:heme/copper-type cytochrome/quinol oxidase subunit 3
MSASASAEHHEHGPIVWPRDAQYGAATPGKIGMWIFLCSDALSFSGLLLSYGILRAQSGVWRHAEEPILGINFTAGLTFLLICSSVTMVLAYAASAEGNRKAATRWLFLTALGGALFLCGQYQEYFGIWSEGLTKEGLLFGHSHYASTFYLVTSFHGAHVFSGVVYILIIAVRTAKGTATTSSIELVGLFWHFVDLIWILVFTLVYLIPLETFAGAAKVLHHAGG